MNLNNLRKELESLKDGIIRVVSKPTITIHETVYSVEEAEAVPKPEGENDWIVIPVSTEAKQ